MFVKYFFFAISLAYVLNIAAQDSQHPFMPSALPIDSYNAEETDAAFWNDKAQTWLAEKLKTVKGRAAQTKKAKNIIMFLGDGMSVHTLTATRNFLGDANHQLSFEKFPYVGLSRTYCVDKQVADSACTSTAYLGGVKANYGTLGVNANVLRGNCYTGQNSANHVDTIAKWAQDAGKHTGFVTTARVTHASPAGLYAHIANRDWEHNNEINSSGCSDKEIVDIARQLIEEEVGQNFRVIMGGGRRNFRDKQTNDEEGYPNRRTDGRNLIEEWLSDKKAKAASANYVWSKKGLSLVDLDKTDYLFGLFGNSHVSYTGDLERERMAGVYPTLTEMTEAALKILQKNEQGFFLFVEGARIDMAHHDTQARKSLEETAEFSKAIQRALEMTSNEDTLIVVTSDHSHTMTVNGYPRRGDAITGLSPSLADDDLPQTILSYANGPGYRTTVGRASGAYKLVAKDTESADFEYPATVPLDSETHGGDDVGIFATGPFAQYFSGNYEQSNIPALMARAANIGPFANL